MGHLLGRVPGGQPAMHVEESALESTQTLLPAHTRHGTRSPHGTHKQISEARIALVRGLCPLSTLAKDIGDKMRSSYGTELTFEDEDYPRKRVNIGTSFPRSEPLLRTELTGQLLEVEIQSPSLRRGGPVWEPVLFTAASHGVQPEV